MIEKVNPSHPDKVADRIAGAIVDLAYKKNNNPKVAVEVLIGHGVCHIIAETSEVFTTEEVKLIVERIAGNVELDLVVVKQDPILAKNQLDDDQEDEIKCGYNGIFKGEPLNYEEVTLSKIAKDIYGITKTDGKYIMDDDKLIIWQSHIDMGLAEYVYYKSFNWYDELEVTINPLGDWTGGINVDTGATNRKLGSDMGHSVTGGGLHGKDLSKADVSINIYAFLKAQRTGETVEISCAIGDEFVDGKPYAEIVEIARKYIEEVGGFEKFAEWGLF